MSRTVPVHLARENLMASCVAGRAEARVENINAEIALLVAPAGDDKDAIILTLK